MKILSEKTKRKISESLKGSHHTIKTREKMSKSRTGKGNSMWDKHQSKETKSKISKKAKERFENPQNHPRWKGGRRQHFAEGYIEIYMPNHPFKTKEGYVKEHRLVMEKYLNRFLNPQEVVHHMNGKRNDNCIENLMLFETDNVHKLFHKNIRHQKRSCLSTKLINPKTSNGS